jgi:peroxiredoxin
VKTVEHPAAPIAAGEKAPDFELNSTPDQKVSLADFRGRPKILAFYPEDWSPVCSDQLALYQELLPEFQRYDAELLGVSVDGIWCHLAFANDRNLHFPLLFRLRAERRGRPRVRRLPSRRRDE